MRIRHLCSLAFLSVSLLLPAACSGGGVSGDCQRICSVVAGCYGTPSLQTQCATSCLDRAGGSDPTPAAAAVVRSCADCVSAQSCLALATGACNASCPTGSLTTSPSPSPTSPSQNGCVDTVALDGGSGQISCEQQSSDYHCKCYADGVFTDSFRSIDFCTASASARATQIAKGCRYR